jgi:hypothetical protein
MLAWVTPLGEPVADAGRGLVYGNRGCLHDETGHIRRRYNGKRWIACLRWTAAGYIARRPRRAGQQALAITPPSLVSVVGAGWSPLVPLLHPSATR